ncbi:MAG: hypothetical protein KatS3mg100_657 [Candidatus Parcubacteria bacterium]|nr:MAG: hypothetical protein KatS3mg100_657 [Candidatus Parcubacteria bacterium]
MAHLLCLGHNVRMARRAQHASSFSAFERDFLTRYKSLDASQREAVDALAGPVVVVAGPGTGKTHTLTLRIANIIRATYAPPSAILALTFSDAAAREMRARLIGLIGPSGYEPTITTFHGFAGKILQEFGQRVEVADELAQYEIVEAFVESEEGRAIAGGSEHSRQGAIQDLLELFHGLKREGWSPQAYRAWIAEERARVPEQFAYKRPRKGQEGNITKEGERYLERLNRAEVAACAYAQYEAELARRGLVDFEGVIAQAIALLEEDPTALQTLRERYLSVLIDEFQDTNPLQLTLAQILLGDEPRPEVFVVGDPEQAIYRFQGAASGTLELVCKMWGARRVVLGANYRSRPEILHRAGALLRAGGEAHWVHNLTPRAREELLPGWGDAVRVVEAQTKDDEARFVAEEIAGLQKKGVALREIAVLARKHDQLSAVARELSELGVPHQLVGRGVVPQREPAVRLFYALLQAIADPRREGAWAQALQGPWVPGRAEERLWAGERIADLLAGKGEKLPAGVSKNVWKALGEWVLKMRAVAEEASARPAEEVVIRAARESDFLGWAAREPVVYHAFEVLLEDVRAAQGPEGGVPILREALARLERRARGGIRREGAPLLSGDVVRLMTVHFAKGQEFDAVFLVGASAGVWEEGFAREGGRFLLPPVVRGAFEGQTKEGRRADERRLFFVGLTRARRGVAVSYPLRVPENEKPLEPSVFVQDLAQAGVRVETLSRAPLAAVVSLPKRHKRFAEWVRERFFATPLSVTALNNYLADPWLYLVRSLLRLPEGREPHLAYGTALDQAVEAFLRAQGEGEEMDEEALVRAFTKAWDAQEPALWFGQEVAERYAGQAREVLPAWARKRGGWAREVGLRPKRRFADVAFALSSGETLWLKGEVDAWFSPQAGEVVVVDIKSGAPGNSEFREDYERQLLFYKLLWECESGGRERVRRGVLEHIAPGRGGIVSKEFALADEAVARLESAIAQMAQEIKEGAPWLTPPRLPRRVGDGTAAIAQTIYRDLRAG